MPIQTVEQAMDEFRHGNLHSGGSGKVVTSRAQALAIGLSSQRHARAQGARVGRRNGRLSAADQAAALRRD